MARLKRLGELLPFDDHDGLTDRIRDGAIETP